MTPPMRVLSRQLTDADIDTMLVPMRDIAPLIAQAVRGRDEEINALRRLVADQATRIALLADTIAAYESDTPATTH